MFMFNNTGPDSILALIYNNFGPYHLARLETASRLATKNGLQVLGIELASREAIHPWVTCSNREVDKFAIFSNKTIEEIPAWSLATGMWATVAKINPRAIAMGPSREAFAAYFAALLWARLKKRVIVIMMDSKYDDYPRNPIKERFKRKIFSGFDAALVGGTHSREYAARLGIPSQRIFAGGDVVDNDYFAGGAGRAREQAASWRRQYGLPEDYFLYVGRFDDKKNVSGLLQAYAQCVKASVNRVWGLVLCGSGPLEERLHREARQLGLTQVIFAGFKQIDELPIYYGLARCLVTPSSHSEQWGLVVNEAMAAGLPVLVSRACGCAPDLVQEGVNGFTFDPYDVEGLAQLMGQVSSGAVNLAAMGQASRRLIADWGLETYARNLLQAVEAGMAYRSNPLKFRLP
jgi:1,2-diacylglycerol 3-alpha-glucosyltransferase